MKLLVVERRLCGNTRATGTPDRQEVRKTAQHSGGGGVRCVFAPAGGWAGDGPYGAFDDIVDASGIPDHFPPVLSVETASAPKRGIIPAFAGRTQPAL